MKSYSRSHLSQDTLLSHARLHQSQDRVATAELLADLAEIEERKSYAAIGFPSMHAYCVQELYLTDDEADNRIHAARTARRHPAIFHAVAEGRLHMTAVNMLAPYLTAENATELLAAAMHKSKVEIRLMLAERFPRPDVPALLQPVSMSPIAAVPQRSAMGAEQPVPERVKPMSGIAPLAPQRFALQLTISQKAHDTFRHIADLLSHQVRPGDLAQVFERAMEAAVRDLEKRKFAATSKPRDGRSTNAEGRNIPASVQRAVWQRDGGQCTFASASGRRCAARTRLEFDHIQEVARGGSSSISNIRLLCRTHNQYAAEQTYGPGFMRAKRQDVVKLRAREAVEEVIPYLRALGCRPDEARRAAERCESIPNAPLDQRVRLAVSQLGPRGCRTVSPQQGGAAAP